MSTLKADLHYHGPIGFQDYWLRVQGYQGKNLLKEIVDAALRKDIGLVAITSDEDAIPKNSLHDRFNWLKEKYAKSLPEEYSCDSIGKNILRLVKDGEVFSQEEQRELPEFQEQRTVYIINSQSVRTKEKETQQTQGLTKQGIIDYLVIGTNQIPNHKPLEYTVKLVQDNGFVGVAEHVFCTAHGGMGEKQLETLLGYIEAIEGHNSQLIMPFGNYARKLNKQAIHYALKNEKPWIATSDGHRIRDVGISYIEFDEELIDTSSEEKFLETLQAIIASRQFTQHCAYQNFFGWCDWVSKLIYGVAMKKDKS
jgi:predicted metal-dependent phosphoesterase TrpH